MWSTIMFGTEAPDLFLEWSYSGMSPLVGATLRLTGGTLNGSYRSLAAFASGQRLLVDSWPGLALSAFAGEVDVRFCPDSRLERPFMPGLI